MTIVLTKKATPPIPALSSVSTLPLHLSAVIEEVGAMQHKAEAKVQQIKALQAEVKPYAEKLKALAELITLHATQKGLSPDKEFTELTDGFLVDVGKASTVRNVVDVELAMKRLGKKVFFEKATIGLGVLDQYLTPDEKEGVIGVERGVRGIKIVRKAQPHRLE